jgi:hypothetical protein
MAFWPKNKIVDYDTYVNRGYPSSDWLIIDDDSAVFIEAKTFRMRLNAKASLLAEDVTPELEKLAESVLQAYKSIHHYEHSVKTNVTKHSLGHFQHIYPFVVTFDDWFLMGKPKMILNEMVRKLLIRREIPVSYLVDMPFQIVPVGYFEIFAQLLNDEGIYSVMSVINRDSDRLDWSLESSVNYLFKAKMSKYRMTKLFPEEMKKIMPSKLQNEW